MPIRTETRYHLEVAHKPGEWQQDMDYLAPESEEAQDRIKELKEKYPGKEVIITKITKIEFEERISENDLETDVSREED